MKKILKPSALWDDVDPLPNAVRLKRSHENRDPLRRPMRG